MAELRQHALACLARRDYSRAELRARLRPLAADDAAVDEVLDRLESERLLSDQRYANGRVATRAVRYGNVRLKHELRQHGISDDDIAAALPEGGDEAARCRAVWARKFGCLPTDASERGRQMRFLQYRGFSGEAIRGVMRGADE